jgi:hypothetical protein
MGLVSVHGWVGMPMNLDSRFVADLACRCAHTAASITQLSLAASASPSVAAVAPQVQQHQPHRVGTYATQAAAALVSPAVIAAAPGGGPAPSHVPSSSPPSHKPSVARRNPRRYARLQKGDS